MPYAPLENLTAEIRALRPVSHVGRVCAVQGNTLQIMGLSGAARMGDRLRVTRRDGASITGEVIQMDHGMLTMLPEQALTGVSLGDRVRLLSEPTISPADTWIGRVIDPFGVPIDGRPLLRGGMPRALRADPPAAAERRAMGGRLETMTPVFNTFLPIVQGQRIGLFAGSGVGKSSLLGHLARKMEADVVVFAMIGERGRELRDFVENVLGPDGMARSVIVAATSDRSPLVRRRCAWTAMSVAEHFRDQGKHVLFLADSITRFAEAHREIATAAGEMPALRGYPPSLAHMIMSLCERAGPGAGQAGDITALFSVLVAGSDMEEPVADILRGVLDGHVVMDRKIAERGRYPAIDLLRSVSRSLPNAATEEENTILQRARALLGAYANSETLIRAGLYSEGADAELDQAIALNPEMEAFLGHKTPLMIEQCYDKLRVMMRRAEKAGAQMAPRGAGSAMRKVPAVAGANSQGKLSGVRRGPSVGGRAALSPPAKG